MSDGAVRLAFETQPSDAVPFATVTPLVRVAIRDSAGNVVTTAADTVALVLGSNPAGANFRWHDVMYNGWPYAHRLTSVPAGGVATFDVRLDKVGSGYTLTASAARLAGATSNAFDVLALDLASVSAGDLSSCGVTAGGTAYCWGSDVARDRTDRPFPVAVTGGVSFAAVSDGPGFRCALAAGGAAYCWSVGEDPVAVRGGLTFTTLSAGTPDACGLTPGGLAYCWQPPQGLANGTDPAPVPGGLTFSGLSVGWGAACAVDPGGTAYCWGGNYHGLLGTGDTLPRSTPTAVVGGHVFRSVSVGGGHACGLTPGGAAYCWGENHSGQLGLGSAGGYATAPVAVTGGLTFAAVSAGGLHTCGVTTNGAAYCWGSNHLGQLGNGDSSDLPHLAPTVAAPVAVAGGLTFLALSAGARHTCGTAAGGVTYCWGANEHGQLGVGACSEYTSIPARIVGQR